ncbi:MAG: zinc ABC transporter substrate-binding protein [Acidimicrobiales bacterium]|jgi:zinc/manganese transport system substrate-binding protein|nr:zinc ABC transporter substrate-binding protein [Acidimicrobiales bacterium]
MRRPTALVPLTVVAVLTLAACGSDGDTDQASAPTTAAPAPTTAPPTTAAEAPCPVAPIPVVVSVDQWGDIVEQLGGTCTEVTTIIQGSSADPHDYEPTAADTAEFSDARLVVVNGADYDHWASDAVEALSPQPALVDAGEVVGVDEGDNPHIWYGPDFVTQVSQAVTAELSALEPAAAAYFADRATDWDAALEPYFAEIDAIRTAATGTSFGSTESVFDYMADALGLVNATPQGYRNAAANESDPAPGDVAEFQQALRDGSMAVLIYNTQTEGSVPEQLRSVATESQVPVVDVTETVPPGVDSFVEWQVTQLQALRTALG